MSILLTGIKVTNGNVILEAPNKSWASPYVELRNLLNNAFEYCNPAFVIRQPGQHSSAVLNFLRHCWPNHAFKFICSNEPSLIEEIESMHYEIVGLIPEVKGIKDNESTLTELNLIFGCCSENDLSPMFVEPLPGYRVQGEKSYFEFNPFEIALKHELFNAFKLPLMIPDLFFSSSELVYSFLGLPSHMNWERRLIPFDISQSEYQQRILVESGFDVNLAAKTPHIPDTHPISRRHVIKGLMRAGALVMVPAVLSKLTTSHEVEFDLAAAIRKAFDRVEASQEPIFLVAEKVAKLHAVA